MGQPSSDWLAERRAAEQEFQERFANLEAVLVRVDGYVRRAEASAAVLARMPNGDPAERLREAEDLRKLVSIAAHHLANLDRVHLIEEPSRRADATTRAQGRAR